jgi:hypothetical protein
LRALLDEVAETIGTRPVDNVYLTPGTEVAVFERGGLWRQLQGNTERCLILGIGVLEGFQLGPLRAVLAHEYGHFQNRDTAGGGLALAVRRSLFTMAQGLAQGGAAALPSRGGIVVQRGRGRLRSSGSCVPRSSKRRPRSASRACAPNGCPCLLFVAPRHSLHVSWSCSAARSRSS